MAENLKESMPDDQKMIAELETVLQIENEVKNKKEEVVSSAETSLTKLQSDKDDSLSPVRLCSSLYSEVFRNYMSHDLWQDRLTETRRQNNFDKIIKFGLIGKEALVSVISSFKAVDQLILSEQVEFSFGFMFRSYNYYSVVCNGSDNFVKKLLTVAVPFVKVVHFKSTERKWQNYFFEVLSKDSQQKKLKIYGLKEVDDLAKMTLKKLVESGVLVKFGFNENNLWENLPDCQFESLTFFKWHTDFLSKSKELKCSFNKLKFVGFYLVSASGDRLKPYCSKLECVFPKCQNLVFEIEMDTEFDDYYEYSVKECLNQMIEAVEDAPQNKIVLNVVINQIRSRSDLPQRFLCKDEKVEYGHNYEWKSESNENKIIKLEIKNVDSDYDFDSSSDDYYYDSDF
uniref:Uncharacterized protein n=1 Tax=Panagrolaimus sp. JU765 TaxID=591449 RepID=A0AC34Q0N5_9BILA